MKPFLKMANRKDTSGTMLKTDAKTKEKELRKDRTEANKLKSKKNRRNLNVEKQAVDEEAIAALFILGISHIYHITHIDNLRDIYKYGLLPHNNVHRKIDISNQAVNARRERSEPIYGKSVHDYVPFYFNPRNAMLYKTQSDFGNKIVILRLKNELLLQNQVIYTNSNAAVNSARYSNNINDLHSKDFIDFSKVFSENWSNHGIRDDKLKQTMMAEVLIPKYVAYQAIDAIICFDQETREFVFKIIGSNKVDIIVDKSKFFEV